MIKRPSSRETEEDLLKLQNEYLQSKQKPSASVKRVSQRDVVDLSVTTNTEKDNVHHISSVLKKIIEKPISDVVFERVPHYRGGFPSVPSVFEKDTRKVPSAPKKKSLFAQQFAQLDREKDFGLESYGKTAKEMDDSEINDGDYVVNEENVKSHFEQEQSFSSPEKKSIHEENKEKLKNMSESEILQEQENLLQSLDPKLVAFLKSRNTRKPQQEGEEKLVQKQPDNLEESKKTDTEMRDEVYDQQKVKLTESIDPYQEFDIKKNYVNMNEVEREKLEWMKNVPKITLQKSDSVTPRFDFEGDLLPPDQDIPTHLGLHHHGDEPSLPGYSLEELFHMVRSNFLQQRSFGLLTLAKIIRNFHLGKFMQKLSTNLLETCLGAGLVFILRWSLDEQTEPIYSAALSALANVIYIEKDQKVLERLSYAEDGFKIPSLCTYHKKKTEEMTQEEQEENRDLTDAELMERDVIKAMLQMRILPRLRYLLEMCKLSETATKNLLCVLQRIVQHDKGTAYEVYKCPGMMRTLMSMINRDQNAVEGLKLVRSLFITGRNITHNFISSYPSLLEFMVVKFSSFSFNGDDLLYIQVCKLWNVMLSYDLTHQLVSDLHPVLLQHMQTCSVNYTIGKDPRLASTVLLVRQIFKAAETREIQLNIVEGLWPLIQFNFHKVLSDVVNNEKVTHPLYLSSLMSCCCQYFMTKNLMVSDTEPVSLLTDVTKFWNDHIANIIDSKLMKKLLLDASGHSDFKTTKEETLKSLENLPCYGTSCFGDEEIPSTSSSSPLILVQTLMKTLHELISINKQLILKVRKFITSPDVLAWLTSFVESEHLKRCTVLVTTRTELLTVAYCVQIYHRTVTSCGMNEINADINNLYLQVAGRLITLLQPGEEEIVLHLMRNFLFNEQIIRNKQYVLWVSDATTEETKKRIENHLKIGLQQLQQIGSMYEANLFPKVNSQPDGKLETLLTPSRGNKILPSDWMLYPMVQLYNESLNLELSGKMISRASRDALIVLQDCLRFLLLLEVTRPSLLAEISETLRLTRLMCVFLTEGDLYSEETVRDLLTSLLSVYTSRAFQSYLDFEKPVPGITSFYDLYNSLLGQYLSASYGDHIFSNMILMPMQPSYLVKYRRAIWSEFSSILRVFPIPMNKIMLDVKSFFAEQQEDIEMIKLYYQMYISSRLKKQWCPLFYVIAVHHLSSFIFKTTIHEGDEKDEFVEERRIMLRGILNLKDTELRDDVIYYQIFDIDSCLKRFVQLPPSRELMLRDAVK